VISPHPEGVTRRKVADPFDVANARARRGGNFEEHGIVVIRGDQPHRYVVDISPRCVVVDEYGLTLGYHQGKTDVVALCDVGVPQAGYFLRVAMTVSPLQLLLGAGRASLER
jgi:hypothetical protein